MSAVGFASGGYVAQAGGPVQTTVCIETELQGVITEDCAVPDYDILTFAGPAAVEIGTIVASPAFTATHNRPPTALLLTNDDNVESKSVVATPNAFNSDQDYQKNTPSSVAFTLSGSDGGLPDAENVNLAWQARIWVARTTLAGPYTEAQILAMNGLVTSVQGNALWQETMAPTNEYLIGVYHDSFNGAVATDFLIGNFIPGGAAEIQTGLSMAIPNGSGLFTVARSNLIQTSGALNWQRLS